MTDRVTRPSPVDRDLYRAFTGLCSHFDIKPRQLMESLMAEWVDWASKQPDGEKWKEMLIYWASERGNHSPEWSEGKLREITEKVRLES